MAVSKASRREHCRVSQALGPLRSRQRSDGPTTRGTFVESRLFTFAYVKRRRRPSHGNSWRNACPEPVPDLRSSIKNEEAVWRASRMLQAHCRESVPAGLQKHLSPVYDEFFDLDRLFLAALPNPLNSEHRVA